MQQPEAPTTTTTEKAVYVTNIAPKATDSTIRDFFSFCGKIEQLTLQRAGEGDGVQEAIVHFSEENATKTALLLTNALILDRPITVVRYDPLAHGKPAEKSESGTPSAESAPKDSRPGSAGAPRSYSSVIAGLIAGGYNLGADALQKAKEYDEEYQVSANIKAGAEKVSTKAGEIDETYKISETTKAWTTAAAGKISQLDKSYGVSETVSTIGASASSAVKQVTESPPVTATVGAIKQSGATIATYAGGVSAEAAKVFDNPTVKSAGDKIKSTTDVVKGEFTSVVDQANKKIKEKETERNEASGAPVDEGKQALLNMAASDSESSNGEEEEKDKITTSEATKGSPESGKSSTLSG